MTFRENIWAILHYETFERLPVVSFGYWKETLEKWAGEGHVTWEEAEGYARDGDNSEADQSVMKRLGFDFNWNSCYGTENFLYPDFETKVLEVKPDGSQIVMNGLGMRELIKPGVVCLPGTIGTSLTDREAWEELYLPKFQWCEERVNTEFFKALPPMAEREIPIGLHCGSLIGKMRNMIGVEDMSYLYYEDEDLYAEIIETIGTLAYKCVEAVLKTGAQFDYAHYWEDVCCKSGPLVSVAGFRDYVAPQYKRISDLLKQHGVDIVSVDCDGVIDVFVPTWLESGVNTMFPIEVGTWNASIAPWREKYGKELRGVGGMNKNVFSRDYAAVDAEIERLKPLIELGGYIPCPDHRIAPDAKFENVQYYCEKMQKLVI